MASIKSWIMAMLAIFCIFIVFIVTSCAPAKGTGTLVLQITDAPSELNIQKALMTISMVQVHKSGDPMGNSTTNSTANGSAESSPETETSSNVTEDDSGVSSETGWITIVAEPQEFDLIAIKDVNEFLGSKALQAGKYTQIRLTVEKAVVMIDDKEYNLKVPSGKIKLIHPFIIEVGKNTTLTLDFDAQKSITSTGKGSFNLKPTIKVVSE